MQRLLILAMLALTKWFVCYSHERMPKAPALTIKAPWHAHGGQGIHLE